MTEQEVRRHRWWQQQCPFDWKAGEAHYHIHHCVRAATGLPHEHVCDCGARFAA